jgi:intein-encoded DNA endonuclease-like protein
MNRYYDGIDLAQMTISMIYKNKSNKAGKAKIVNMQYGTDKIRFAWLVDGSVT